MQPPHGWNEEDGSSYGARESGFQEVIEGLPAERRFEVPLEQAILLTVLHRRLCPGSARASERWREDYAMAGSEGRERHHLCRAMAWLGEPLADQRGVTPSAVLP